MRRWRPWGWRLGIGLAVVAAWFGLAQWQGQAAYRQGVALASSGQYAPAVQALDRAHAWQPWNPWVLAHRGIARRELCQYDAALADFTDALRLQHGAQAATSYCGRGDTYRAMRHHTEAKADYERALALTPQDVRANNNLAWLLTTCRDAKVHDPQRALRLSVIACRRTAWKDPACLDTLAAVCAALGRPKAAVHWARTGATLTNDPHEKALYANRAEIYRSGKVLVEKAM